MPTLLCSLGATPAVVIEAALYVRDQFRNQKIYLRILTSDSDTTSRSLEKIKEFFDKNSIFDYEIARIEGFSDLRNLTDQALMEESMFRWYLEERNEHRIQKREKFFVCIAGGFKTMSSAMQQAATLFGADQLFHVMAERCIQVDEDIKRYREPVEIDEIIEAFRKKKIHIIDLGKELGWPQLRRLEKESFPLQHHAQKISPHPSGERILSYIRALRGQLHNISENWAQLSRLPFPQLSTWTPQELQWLQEPLNEGDRQWIKKLPKIDLHLHLGGFATHGVLLEKVRKAAKYEKTQYVPVNHELPQGWPLPETPIPLASYMKLGDNTGSQLLKDPGCLKKQCELLYQSLMEENIVYAEVRCSPANYADISMGRTPFDVLSEIRDHFAKLMEETEGGPHVNLLIIATRREGGDYRADIARHIALAVTGSEQWVNENFTQVVGVDLAGFENKETRAQYFREDFTAVHRSGIAITVHAGENDDVEGIWRAVFDLNARRIGHALSLADSPFLIQSMASRGITVEMCPYANYQIKGFYPMKGQENQYPMKRYIDSGIPVTINTDNPGISGATLSDNILHAAKMNPEVTKMDILQCQRNALEGAFIIPSVKNNILERLSVIRLDLKV